MGYSVITGACVAILVATVALAEVDKWAWTANFESKITLSCNNSKFDIETSQNITWILPDKDGESVAKGWSDETREVIGDRGQLMHVKIVKPGNSGIYTCMIHMADGTINTVKRGLNLAGPSVTDLWKKYQTNVMIGGIAAGSCLGFFIIACLVYKFRYKEPGSSKFSDTGLDNFNSYQGQRDSHVYDNPVSVKEDEKVAPSNGAAGSKEDDTRM